MWKYQMFLHYQFWHCCLLSTISWPSSQGSPIFCVFIWWIIYSTIKKGQMDMIIRFWDNSTNMVSAKYYNSKFLGMAVAVGVHSKLQSSTKSLDASKMIQVFLDFFLSFSVIWWDFIHLLELNLRVRYYLVFIWNNRRHMLTN